MQHQGESPRRRDRVVVVVLPFQGHLNPILELAKILHSIGFPITITHPEFNCPDPSTHPEFDYLCFRGFVPSSGFMDRDGNIDLSRLADMILNLNERCRNQFRRAMEELMRKEEEKGGRIGCIVYDQYMFLAQDVAKDLNLKGVVLRTGGAITLLAFAGGRRMDQQGSKSVTVSEARKHDDSNIGEVYKAIEAMLPPSFSELTAAVNEAFSSAAAIILNTMESLESQALRKVRECYVSPILTIGPFHKITCKSSPNSLLKEDWSCIPWLDEQEPRSVLYVSFGSIASISEAEFMEIALGLEAAEQPFLWVIRKELIHGRNDWNELLPQNLKNMVEERRSCIVSWAPQKRVLAHQAVGAFWSHCGWNSTLESICEGVPVLCRPFFGDQPADAKYIARVWKVGLELKDNRLERSEIEKCIRTLMVEKEGEEIRARAAALKEKIQLNLSGGPSEKNLNRLEDLTISV
ncbi:hypothetical protein Droror1_Dr00001198 [Drosera rotundifolia]